MGKRLASLDVFRGIDMWIITGGAFFLRSLGELVTGDRQCWLALTHVAWGECLLIYDFVLPLFSSSPACPGPIRWRRMNA